MSRRVHDLTIAGLHDLPSPCRSCVFWESLDGERGGSSRNPEAATVAKEAWWQATQLEWGTPGKAVYLDDHLVAYAWFGPSAHFPRARRLGPSVSEDALLLATLWVDPAYRDGGLAKVLLQSVLRDAHRHGVRALECYGDRSALSSGPSEAHCILPEGFLLQAGFTVRHDHHAYPLLRLDLRQTVRWQESFNHALEGVISALSRRERAPAPAPARPAASRRPSRRDPLIVDFPQDTGPPGG
jgi:GNAT superfamily N-acetyltransferase